MISYLKGKIIKKTDNFVILDVNNIGYQVFLNNNTIGNISVDEELTIYTHQHIREDSLDLYGFIEYNELIMFELLLSISGIGPKSALASLAIGSVDDLKMSIASGDPELLKKVSGIGKKTAERVVLELKDKVAYIETEEGTGNKMVGLVGNDRNILNFSSLLSGVNLKKVLGIIFFVMV